MLLDDDVLRCNLAEAGRNYAIEKFNWRAVGERYAKIISALFEDTR
jgi:glycosyltransferase involved in cell wall biosynthesis